MRIRRSRTAGGSERSAPRASRTFRRLLGVSKIVPTPNADSFRRYLAAKRTVDERALNGRVHDRLQGALAGQSAPLRVLEAGAGIGSTIERLATWDPLPAEVEYTAVDVDPALLQATRERLGDRVDPPTFDVGPDERSLLHERKDRRLTVELVARDVFDFVAEADRQWDVLIAQAFLDLYDVRPALARLCAGVVPGGLLYFPITFDGATRFEPAVDPDVDAEIERRYHAHMDGETAAGRERGDSQAGRHLLSILPQLGGTVLAVGSSDWVVLPHAEGYPADEAYFLHYIIDTMRGALDENRTLDAARFEEWVETRHRQIEDAELVYVAHQLDVLGRAPT